MATKEIDVLFNTKNNSTGANKAVSDLKKVEDQANRTRQKMQQLQQVGSKLMFAGGAILAPFALAMNKYISTAKDAEGKRLNAIEKANDTAKDLEKERLELIRSNAEKIKDIEQSVADKRVSLADLVRAAEEKIKDVRASLANTLKDIAKSREEEERSYARQLEDISLMGVELTEEQRKQMALQRAKEDHENRMQAFADAEIEAKKKAAAEEKKIRAEAAREAQKMNIEIARLEEEKRSNKELERIQLDEIAKKEKQAQAEKAAALAQVDKQYAGIMALSKEWEKSQVEIGKVTAEILLPAMKSAVEFAGKLADFAKEHPGAIKAAIGIGGTLVVLGGLLSTAASIVSTLATIQGLAAGLGVATGGAGLSAAIAPVLTMLAPIALIAAQIILIAGAVVLAAELTRQLVNWALGTDTTWKDIATTAKQLVIIIGKGVVDTVRGIGAFFMNLGATIRNGFITFGNFISAAISRIATAISNIFRGGAKAEGGMTTGVSIAGEAGREFVMSNRTTRAAESIIGGQLTQQKLLQSLSGGGRRISYYDNRRIDSNLSMNDRRVIKNDILGALAGAI